jgi:hypothetical protein
MTDVISRDFTEYMTNAPLRPKREEKPVPYAFSAEEDRCAIRYKVDIQAGMRFSGSNRFDVTISDMSLAGFSCDALLQIHPGTMCWLSLPGFSSLPSEVVRYDNRGLGCAFAQL